ncbi:MAG: hypothetical protein ACRCX2_27220 [Paraclostridium sp.]
MLLFDRKTQLITEDGTIYSSDEGVRFNFEYSTMTKTGVPTAEIEILNLDRTLKNQFKAQGATFLIGYGDYLADLVNGGISNIEIDETITFDLMGSNKNSTDYSNWYSTDTREDFIVSDIAKNAGMKITGAELLSDYNRANGYSCKGSAIQSIQAICDNRGLGVTFSSNSVKIYEKKGKEEGEIILDVTSGLTNVSKYSAKDSKGNVDTKYDYVIHALPIPKLGQGQIIQVIHDNFSGRANVVDYEIRGAKNWKAKYYVKVVSK